MWALTLDSERKASRHTILCLAVLLAGCQEQQRGQHAADPEFHRGRQELMQGKFQSAIKTLEDYLKANPQAKLSSRASFLIAKAHLGLGHHEEARSRFQKTIADYPQSEEAHKSRYKLAVLSWLEDDLRAARQQFEQLTDRPDGTLVPEATAMLRYLDDIPQQPERANDEPVEGAR